MTSIFYLNQYQTFKPILPMRFFILSGLLWTVPSGQATALYIEVDKSTWKEKFLQK